MKSYSLQYLFLRLPSAEASPAVDRSPFDSLVASPLGQGIGSPGPLERLQKGILECRELVEGSA